MEEVLVLWWRYSDGSGAGVVRAYTDKTRAEEDMRLIEESCSSKDFKLEWVPLFAGDAP